ncbi:CDP-diacylglycerol--serine O-phosphatidyltransferase [Malassezia psittaci]|uniref:CDP-diacylglycerol--serine O-phosphatidyltransferase n=1 Tax=Malassezia psittaci TaxID=1821823 RepID=A0AAF0JEK5_9BASI|nr:CDP-diacylglycerol--serine O-phosphatidyltransferase [Malassezia psittaci]
MSRNTQGLHKRRGNASEPPEDNDNVKGTELRKFIDTNGHFSLVRNFHLADAFTLMNGFCGAQSIFMSARFLLTSEPKYMWYALWLPFFGAIFDLLDGKIARWRRSSSMLGQELDSLADSVRDDLFIQISFGVAPTAAAFALGLRHPLDTLCLTVFVCSGVARLARFNITAAYVPHDAGGKMRYFEGLPIPSSLILVIGMAVCLLCGRFEDANGAWVPNATYSYTGYLGSWLRSSPVRGVPLGEFVLDLTIPLYKFLMMGNILPRYVSPAHIAEFANTIGYLAMHKISIVFVFWSIAMVSKTMHVPKP